MYTNDGHLCIIDNIRILEYNNSHQFDNYQLSTIN